MDILLSVKLSVKIITDTTYHTCITFFEECNFLYL